MTRKKILVNVCIVLVIVALYSVSVYAINAFGNPFVDNKSHETPTKAVAEVLDEDYSIDEMHLNDFGGLVVCHNDDETVIRWLLIDEDGKWYDATENVIYCKDVVTKDDKDDEPYTLIVK